MLRLRRVFAALAMACVLAPVAMVSEATAIAPNPVCMSGGASMSGNMFPDKKIDATRPKFRRTFDSCRPGERSISKEERWKYTSVEHGDTTALWLHHGLALILFFGSAFALGRGVTNRGWNANETRKALGAMMLVAPFFIAYGLPSVMNRQHVLISFGLFLLAQLAFLEPIRRRSGFLTTCFAAIDRPEDRPHTLRWLLSSYVVTTALTLLMAWWVLAGHQALVFAVVFGVVIGDLLAGVVGYRFGTWHYETSALFTAQTYTRSIQGSAMVFLSTAALIMIFGQDLPLRQFYAALAILPLVLTLAEAAAPHTWDEPVMTLSGMLACLGIVTFWAA